MAVLSNYPPQKSVYIIGRGYGNRKNLLHLSLEERWKDQEFKGNIKILSFGELAVSTEHSQLLAL